MELKNMRREERDGWLELTIDRPKALNALNRETIAELGVVVAELGEREDLRGMILTGGGEKAFVAGADITELTDLTPTEAARYASEGQAVFSAIASSKKPVIAAINGFALGGGCELALSCHIRVVSKKAKLGLPEVGLGVIPGFGGTQRLPRLVGLGRALELILSGEMIGADEAVTIGLANRSTDPGELLEACRAIAASITKRGPLAVSHALAAAVHGHEMPLDQGLAFEAQQFGLTASTNDWKEGTTAFLEKRTPDFEGR